MAQRFFMQEKDYADYLMAGPAFVCNNIGMGADSHRVHKSDCTSLNEGGPAKTGLHTSVEKLCSRNLEELTGELTRLYGGEGVGYKFCAFCFRDRD